MGRGLFKIAYYLADVSQRWMKGRTRRLHVHTRVIRVKRHRHRVIRFAGPGFTPLEIDRDLIELQNKGVNPRQKFGEVAFDCQPLILPQRS